MNALKRRGIRQVPGMLVETASTRIGGVGSDREILVSKHAPGANDLDTLCLERLKQEVIFHRVHLSVASRLSFRNL